MLFAVEPSLARRQTRQTQRERHQIEELAIFLLKIAGTRCLIGHGIAPLGKTVKFPPAATEIPAPAGDDMARPVRAHAAVYQD